MPGLSEIETEILAEVEKKTPAPFDVVRRRHMARLAKVTGNTVAIYATGFIQHPGAGAWLSITNEDVHGFMNILHGTDKEKGLDLQSGRVGGGSGRDCGLSADTSPGGKSGLSYMAKQCWPARRIRW